MKRKLRRIIVLIVLLPMLLLASCFHFPSGNGPSAMPSPTSEASAPVLSPAPTDWHSGVMTDYSGLTPYAPTLEKYTRLNDGALPELVPSDYGTLLPYIGEIMYSNDGYNTVRQYGLVTSDGMIVTDAVYDRVFQGSWYSYSTYVVKNVPAYHLTKLSDKIDENNPWDSERHAVCALDGSWITQFEYKSVFFTDKQMLLVRDYGKNDIDVIDYSGKLLYNTKSLGCYNDIPEASAYKFIDGYGEGLVAVPLANGQSVLIDAMTGQETYIDYESFGAFAGGRLAIKKDGLYGFIDKSQNLVITPQFLWNEYFYHGKCVVQYPDQSYAIIDSDGNVLLKNQYYITRWDSSLYGFYDANNNVTYYDSDLNKQTFGKQQVTPLYGGWFYYADGNDIIILKGGETHTFKDTEGIYGLTNGLAVVYSSGNNTYREGVMTLDGEVIVPYADGQSIVLTAGKKARETYVIASTYGLKPTYKVFDHNGKLLFSGIGNISYNADFNLFVNESNFSYAYMDAAGNDIFRISLMKYMPD